MKNKNIVIMILVLIIVAGGAFLAGTKYQQSKAPSSRQFNGTGSRNGGQNGVGFRPVSGQIINADDKSITVKLQDGSSRIVILSAKTTINKAAEATKADLKTGETVLVVGQQNTDGSVTAQNIQLNPGFGR